MRNFSKIFKYSIAASTIIGIGAYQVVDSKNKISAAWTTNFEPSVQWDSNWDKRDPKFLVKPTHKPWQKPTEPPISLSEGSTSEPINPDILKKTPKARRNIILIRHGQYEDRVKEADKRILTSLGEEQADFTGRRLKELNINYTKLYHSTMIRAIQTADIIRKHLDAELNVEMDDILKEGAPIPPEPPVGHWRPEFHQFFEDGSRIEAAFRKYFHRAEPEQLEDSYEIVVCHANVIRYFICRSLQFPPEAWLRFSLQHGSLTLLTICPDGRVFCSAIGEAGHIPTNKLSSK